MGGEASRTGQLRNEKLNSLVLRKGERPREGDKDLKVIRVIRQVHVLSSLP